MFKKITVLVSAVFLVWAGFALADTVNLPETGQRTCYGSSGNVTPCATTAQDGDIKAGIAWPSQRFTNNGDGTLTDSLSGLMWLKDGRCLGQKTWQAALNAVSGFNSNPTGNNCQGYNKTYTDWRMPNINELESLINAEETNPGAWLNTQGFLNFSGNFWSSTNFVFSTNLAWYIMMSDGSIDAWGGDKGIALYVIPVRTGTGVSLQPASRIWKTGQSTCYDSSGNATPCATTAQDGSIQSGIAWPSDRFTDNGNGTVTDNLTGLMWLKDANCFETKTWQDALNTVNGFNTSPSSYNCNSYNSNNPPYSDWRLPNRKELYSLNDFQHENPALPSGNHFVNVQTETYWASTSYGGVSTADSAWVSSMYDGSLMAYMKTWPSYVWPVRSGSYGNTGTVDSATDGELILDASSDPDLRISIDSVTVDTDPALNQTGNPSENYLFKYGLMAFTVTGLTPGDTITINITYPEIIPPGAKYYKVSASGFSEYPNVTFSGNTATLTLTDGGAGDLDGNPVPDGIIVDPGGVVFSLSSGVTSGGAQSAEGDSGCFIATAAYGSYLADEVKILRAFRDRYLLSSSAGKTFVRFYYRHSPPAAEVISKHKSLKLMTRAMLTPVVYGVKYPLGAGLVVVFGVALVMVIRSRKK